MENKQHAESLQEEEEREKEQDDFDPEVDPEQIRCALARVGRKTREAAFKAGQSVMVLKEGRAVWLHPDGTEQAVDGEIPKTSGG